MLNLCVILELIDKINLTLDQLDLLVSKCINIDFNENLIMGIDNLNLVDSTDLLINIINAQKNKQTLTDKWINSPYKNISYLESNNVGIVGEEYIRYCCISSNILCNIDGSKTKKIGGGNGDGNIKGKSIEIKCARFGIVNSFQHELGEHPWRSLYMIFLDISPDIIYLTIFPNFDETFYKSRNLCMPYFPTRRVCWRKKSGAFKLDLGLKNIYNCIIIGNTLEINKNTSMEQIGIFINKIIK